MTASTTILPLPPANAVGVDLYKLRYWYQPCHLSRHFFNMAI